MTKKDLLGAVIEQSQRSSMTEGAAASIPNPLGEPQIVGFAPSGFDPSEMLADAAQCIPAWQRDDPNAQDPIYGALLERRSILNAFQLLGHVGVIFDKAGHIVNGGSGWTCALSGVATLSCKSNFLAPTSPQSQREFFAAIELLFADFTVCSRPVALRDLDGWVVDIIEIRRVGPANPAFACAMLPKSAANIAANLANVSAVFGLNPLEVELLGFVLKGIRNAEIAGELKLKQSEIKQGLRDLIRKFQVRQKNEIVRLLASLR